MYREKIYIKASWNKAFVPLFFGGRIRLLYERLERISFLVRSGCQHMRCKSLSWNVLALLPQSCTHWCLYRAAPVLSCRRHTGCAHRILPAKWQCSLNLVPHVQRVRYRSLHCHPFRIPILKCAWPAYIHAYIEYVHIYQQPQRRERGRVWAMHALHPVLTTLMMFRTAEDDVWFSARPVCVCGGELCNQVFEDAHRLRLW